MFSCGLLPLLETAMRWHIFVRQIKSCKKITLKRVLPMLASSRCDIMPMHLAQTERPSICACVKKPILSTTFCWFPAHSACARCQTSNQTHPRYHAQPPSTFCCNGCRVRSASIHLYGSREGGIGIIHKNMTPELQARAVFQSEAP